MQTPHNATYKGIPIGLSVTKSIGKDKTYRVRTGNGEAGSKKGKKYQDKYDYKVPSSINNPQSNTSRAAFATAMHNWTYVLTPEQKKPFNDRAKTMKGMFGWCLYIRQYMQDNL